MKRLFLVRHAKSDWSLPGLSDIDRPLNQRGYDDAHRMGAHIKKNNIVPELLISSPAIRALSTALIIAKEINYDKEKIRIAEGLYEAKEDNYYDLISSLDESLTTVFLFGHNPTITDVLVALTKNRITELPTCSVSEINFDGAWNNLHASERRLGTQFLPKFLST